MVLLYDETKFRSKVGISQGRLLMLLLLVLALAFRALGSPDSWPAAVFLCAFASLALARAVSRRCMILCERLAAVVFAFAVIVAYASSALLRAPTATVDIVCLLLFFVCTSAHVFVRLSLGLARARKYRNSFLGAFGFADMTLDEAERPDTYTKLMADMAGRSSDDEDSDSDLSGQISFGQPSTQGQSLFRVGEEEDDTIET